MALPVFSSKAVTLSIAGVAIQGWDTLTFEYNGDNFTPRVSADGKISISLNPDNTARATLTTYQESPSNYGLAALNMAIKNGHYIPLGMSLNDPSGSALVVATGVSVIKAPSIGLASEAGNYDWELFIEDMALAMTPDEIGAILNEADAAVISSAVSTLYTAATGS